MTRLATVAFAAVVMATTATPALAEENIPPPEYFDPTDDIDMNWTVDPPCYVEGDVVWAGGVPYVVADAECS